MCIYCDRKSYILTKLCDTIVADSKLEPITYERLSKIQSILYKIADLKSKTITTDEKQVPIVFNSFINQLKVLFIEEGYMVEEFNKIYIDSMVYMVYDEDRVKIKD